MLLDKSQSFDLCKRESEAKYMVKSPCRLQPTGKQSRTKDNELKTQSKFRLEKKIDLTNFDWITQQKFKISPKIILRSRVQKKQA